MTPHQTEMLKQKLLASPTQHRPKLAGEERWVKVAMNPCCCYTRLHLMLYAFRVGKVCAPQVGPFEVCAPQVGPDEIGTN
jgi:hypothetical protein